MTRLAENDLEFNFSDAALLLTKQDQLHRSILFTHNDWDAPSARSCMVLNLEQYEIQFGENSVRRISEGNT